MSGNLWIRSAIALLCACVCAAAILLTAAAVLVGTQDPSEYVGVAATAAFVIACAVGGGAAARLLPDRPFICAMIGTAEFCFLHFALHAAFGGDGGGARLPLTCLGGAAAAMAACALLRRRGGKRSGIKRLRKRARTSSRK